jgi:hypothetical protein
MAQIFDQMGHFMMDILLQESQEIRLEDRKEEFYNFGKTESGHPGEET